MAQTRYLFSIGYKPQNEMNFLIEYRRDSDYKLSDSTNRLNPVNGSGSDADYITLQLALEFE